MKNKQTYLVALAFVVSVLAPILSAEGYSGVVPVEWVPIGVGLTAAISALVRWYKEREPVKATKWNL